jgi:hypothetical protein
MLHQKADCVEDFPRREATGHICPACGRRARWLYLVPHDGSLPDGACRACLDLTYRSRQTTNTVRAKLEANPEQCTQLRQEWCDLLALYKSLKAAPVPPRIERQSPEAVQVWRRRQNNKAERVWSRYVRLGVALPPQTFEQWLEEKRLKRA